MKPDLKSSSPVRITLTDLLHVLLATLAVIAPLLFAWLLVDRSARRKPHTDVSKDNY
ncbi:hypothetical protein [Ottowia thiooxydans]|uniref:hypothetical protein n=1 Tax=Ottowia thiooxydans TaxID=219182 RepID=UPI00146F2AB6|nr:hypothetical protein [Ottowia thiooxydans]